jgi:hypothetical protein
MLSAELQPQGFIHVAVGEEFLIHRQLESLNRVHCRRRECPILNSLSKVRPLILIP